MRTRPRSLGTRHVCPDCETKYYDMGKPDSACPRCSTPAHSEDGDPRADAMARIKADGPIDRNAHDDEPTSEAAKKSTANEEDEEEELEELGELTQETAANSTDDEYDYN